MSPSTTTSRTSNRRILRALYVLLLVLAAAYFIYRGPYRVIAHPGPDFPVFFAAAHAWVSGENPYDTERLLELYHANGGSPTRSKMLPLLNPPTALPLLAPLALLSYPVANAIVAIINLALVAALPLLLYWVFPAQRPRGPTLAAGVLLLLMWVPVHTSIAQGQNTLAGMALLLLGVGLTQRDRQLPAGLAFALGAAMRPSFFLILPLWYLLNIRSAWRIGLVAALVAGALLTLGITRMEAAGVPWNDTWRQNLVDFRADDATSMGGGIGSLSPDRPSRFIMINLQPLLATWLEGSVITHYGPFALAVLVTCFAWILQRRRNPQPGARLDLLTLAILTTISLLAIYNRFYSAVLALVPLAWALASWNDPRTRVKARLVLVCLLVFLAPGTAAMLNMLPKETLNTWWFTVLLLPHQTYALLAATAILLSAAAEAGPRYPVGPPVKQPPPPAHNAPRR